MKQIILILLLLMTLTGLTQTKSSIVKFTNPSSLSAPNGYSQAAIIDLGNCQMVIFSGQVAFDKQGNLVGKDDVGKQTEQVFSNIKNAISEIGGSMENLVKISFYITDVSRIQMVRDIRNKFINLKNPPTSTLVQVNKLFRDDVLIEIEATAIIPKK